MTRSERRLLVNTSIVGAALTLAVIVLELTGWLAAPDRFFHDVRARYCQVFTPAPTDKLVHIDIDDRSLEAIGYWPWPRSQMAEIVDEIGLAGAKALAMDVIYAEPQPPGYQEIDAADAPAGPATRPAGPAIIAARRIDHDAAFAAALRRFGRAIVPTSLGLNLRPPASPTYAKLVNILREDPEIDAVELTRRLRAEGVAGDTLPVEVETWFLGARREAMFERIEREMKDSENLSLDELRRRILPRTSDLVRGSPVLRALESQYQRYLSVRALRRYGRPVTPDMPPLLTTRDEQATVWSFSEASACSAYVDYIPLADGIVRSVPLWANHRGYAYPHMSLALACMMLDVDTRDVRLTREGIIIPRPGGRNITIPVREHTSPRGQIGMLVDIPWFGSREWSTMYDYPRYQQPKQHIPIRFIWEACEIRHRISRNNENAARAIAHLTAALKEPSLSAQVAAAKPDPGDSLAWKAIAAAVFKEMENQLWLPYFDEVKVEELKHVEEKENWASYRAIKAVLEQNPALQKDLDNRRNELRQQLAGKAGLVGYIAVGAIADFVPTSLHPRCPGVVVHGVVFNSIMNNDFWRPAPRWLTTAISLLLGVVTTCFVIRLSAGRALMGAAALAVGYLLFNGLYLFDYSNLLAGLTSPLLAITSVWAGGTLTRYIIEQAERTRAEKLFRNYVDPSLVDYVLEDENAKVDGQLKDVSVVFTDLQGFTTIAEKYGEQSVPFLNRYMALMVPIIRKQRPVSASLNGKPVLRPGYLNKLLGDGIMYFFAAPLENPVHAVHAIESAFEMHEAMIGFNEQIKREGFPELRLRIGIGSGRAVVGNCGPMDGTFADYTAIGDTVNLSARLEGANKVFGTRIVVNGRTRELAGDRYLFRPIGSIKVKGKHLGVPVFEPLCPFETATDADQRLAELTSAMVEHFAAGRFEACLASVEKLEDAFGPSKLTNFYRGLCQQVSSEGAEQFDGQIVLTEK